MPIWIQKLGWATPYKYASNILVRNEFDGLDLTCDDPSRACSSVFAFCSLRSLCSRFGRRAVFVSNGQRVLGGIVSGRSVEPVARLGHLHHDGGAHYRHRLHSLAPPPTRCPEVVLAIQWCLFSVQSTLSCLLLAELSSSSFASFTIRVAKSAFSKQNDMKKFQRCTQMLGGHR